MNPLPVFPAGHSEFPEALVSRGYTVLDLAYCRQGALPKRLRRIPLEYFEGAFDWLSQQPETEPERYMVIGVSKGGELALLLGSRYEQVGGVAALAPANAVFQAVGLPRLAGSSWSYRGVDVPFVPFPLAAWLSAGALGALTGGYAHVYAESLKRMSDHNEAVIPVERIAGPVLLVSASRDRMWPSKEMCEAMMTRLAGNGFRHHYAHRVIDGSHWVLSSKACRHALFDFLAAHFGACSSS